MPVSYTHLDVYKRQGYEFAAGNVPLLTENIVPVFSCRDKANDGDLAGNGLCQSGTGFASCGVAVKAEEHFLGGFLL